MTNLLRRLGRDTLYVVAGFPLAVLAFSVVLTGLAASLGLLVTLLGIPLGVLTLLAARGFAAVERARLQLLGSSPLAPAGHRRPRDSGWRGLLQRLRDPQSWLDVLHALVGFPLAVVTFAVAVVWWAGTLGGLTYWFWSLYLPPNEDGGGLAWLLGYEQPWAETVLNTLLGLLFAITLVPVLHGCAAVQSGLARSLVANPTLAGLRREVDTLTASRAAVVEAGTSTLRRLERDLHDGPQQRLVRLQMDLAAARRRMGQDPAAADLLVEEAELQVQETLSELRALSRGIAPPVLTDRGLPAALASLAGRCTVQVTLDVALPPGTRLPDAVEEAAYFVVSEALTNVAKHSDAGTCTVHVSRTDGPGRPALRVVVEDDGVGGAHPAKGHGLSGLGDRVAGLDGTLEVGDRAGGGTRLEAVIPCG